MEENKNPRVKVGQRVTRISAGRWSWRELPCGLKGTIEDVWKDGSITVGWDKFFVMESWPDGATRERERSLIEPQDIEHVIALDSC